MSSTNKTANYRLNQWVNTDYVMMSDFNADNAAIDAALSAKANIALGNYVGNGTSAPVSLSFAFAPSVVIVAGMGGSGGEQHEVSVIFIRNHTGAGYTVAKGSTAASVELACRWEGDSLSFNSVSNGANAVLEQLNAQGESYSYAVF